MRGTMNSSNSRPGQKPQTANPKQSTGILTMEELKAMKQRMQIGGLTEEQEARAREVYFRPLTPFPTLIRERP